MRPWSGRSLLADQARLRAGGLLAGCAILVVALGVLFAGQGTADPFDRAVRACKQDFPRCSLPSVWSRP